MEIQLNESEESFVSQQVADGNFANASEVIATALRVLDEFLKDRQARIEDLRAALKEGEEELQRGDFISLEREDLPAFFNQVLADALASQERKAS